MFLLLLMLFAFRPRRARLILRLPTSACGVCSCRDPPPLTQTDVEKPEEENELTVLMEEEEEIPEAAMARENDTPTTATAVAPTAPTAAPADMAQIVVCERSIVILVLIPCRRSKRNWLAFVR